jgi:crossover junction endodeoxyribonuclease RuvC
MTTSNIRFLGIDPGTATTGWAILECSNNNSKPVAYGAIVTDKNKSDEERLWEICQDLEEIIKKYKPAEAAVENLFFFKNQKTIITVAQARGAILLTLKKNRVKIFSYTPLQVKQGLTGYGRAEKKQVQLMAKEILKLKSVPKPDDTADAMAICLCHINSRKLLNLIR